MKIFKISLITLASLVLLFFTIIQGPQIHSYFLRSYVGKKVVTVSQNFGDRIGGGTGFYVKGASGKTYIMTNGHVCLIDREHMNISENMDSVMVSHKVLKFDKKHDLCLIEANDDIEGLDVASSVGIGEIIGLIGHPGLRPLTLARGEIIGKTKIELMWAVNIPDSLCIGRNISVDKLKPADAALARFYRIESICIASLQSNMANVIAYGGNSGSPVVNFYGNVVGVLFAGSEQPTDSYLVPLEDIKRFLKDF